MKDFFELASKGKFQVKGKQAPVEAYRLEGAGEVVDIPLPEKFFKKYGREMSESTRYGH